MTFTATLKAGCDQHVVGPVLASDVCKFLITQSRWGPSFFLGSERCQNHPVEGMKISTASKTVGRDGERDDNKGKLRVAILLIGVKSLELST
jgi:hypothetical protein